MIINVVYCPFYEKIICSQEEYDPEDPANPCTNYPTEEFPSYAACGEEFVKRSLPPDLQPFWSVDNISRATSSFSIKTEDYSDDMIGEEEDRKCFITKIVSEDLFYGTSISDCLLPCLRTKVTVEDKVMMVYNESTTTLGLVV